MTSSIKDLRNAVQVWRADGDRSQIDDCWTGAECGFIKLVQGILNEAASTGSLPDGVTDQLNALCDELEPDLIAARITTEDAEHPFEPQGVFVAERWDQRLSDLERQYAQQLPAEVADRRQAIAAKLLNSAQTRDGFVEPLLRYSLLTAAIALCSRAAVQLYNWDATDHDVPELIVEDLCKAMHCVHTVWPLLTGPLQQDQMINDMPQPENRHKSVIAMRRLLKTTAPGVPTAAWLTVLHLVRHLRGEPAVTTDPAATVPLQVVDTDNQGHSLSFDLATAGEHQTGFFLDLAQTGLLAFDAQMLESLNIAGEIGEAALRDRATQISWNDNGHHLPAVRLSVTVPNGVREIEGDSAGGMAALSLYAVSQGKKPDALVTGSFTIKRKNSERRVSEPDDILADVVNRDTLPCKIDSAGNNNCRRFLLFAGQKTDRLESDAEHHRLRLVAVPGNGFSTAYAAITANVNKEEDLARLAAHVAGAWERQSRAGAAPSDSLRTDKAVNDTHRFDCYIQPDYSIERTEPDLSQVTTERPEQQEAETSDHRTPEVRFAAVPGEDDEKLRQLLRLMFHHQLSAEWNEPPDWLQHDCEKYGPRWLVVYDNAGVGKTVFTHRVVHVAAQRDTWDAVLDGNSPLVLRREGSWPKQNGQYLTLTEFIVHEIQRQWAESDGAGGQRAISNLNEIVEYALRESHLLIILDGFDQFSVDDRRHVTDLLSSRGTERSDEDHRNAVNRCQWIVAGRIHVIDEHRRKNELFADSHWLRVRIDPFSRAQQDQYFSQPDRNNQSIGPEWQRLIGITQETDKDTQQAIRDRMHHLLQLPMTLWYLRWLLENRNNGQPLPVFRTLSELSLITGRRILERALETSADAVEEKLKREGIAPVYPDNPDLQLRLLDKVLSLIAFQMMLEQNYDASVNAGERDVFEQRCRDRWFYELDQEAVSDALTLRRKRELERHMDRHDHHWRWSVAVLEAIVLEHRTVTEAWSGTGIEFRSRKVMEACAARYLTRYATERDVWGQGRDHREYTGDDMEQACAFDFSNDADWKDCWMLALEMPRHAGWHRISGYFQDAHLDPDVTLRSVSVLLEQPKREIRPNQLVYHAWPLLEYDDRQMCEHLILPDGGDALVYGAELSEVQRRQLGKALQLPGADDVLKRFRKSSEDVVSRINACTDRWNHVPPKDTPEHQQWLGKWQKQSSEVKSHTFLRCPPASWLEVDADANVNVMGDDSKYGKSPQYSSQWPQHRVRVQSYQLQSTPVTRGMYGMFDRAFATSAVTASWGDAIREMITMYASPPDGVSGDEANAEEYPIILCDWYDGWMYSKWLGADYSLPSECQQEFGIRGGSAGTFCFGDDTDETQLSHYAWWSENSGDRAHAVGLLRANGYGLYDVHGQVWEWSHDWSGSSWYSTRADRARGDAISAEDHGPASGRSRLLRGSSFCFSSVNAGSSCRFSMTPDYRLYDIGFRVVRLC